MISITEAVAKIKDRPIFHLDFYSKSYLGIDIGTSAVKVVEISKKKGRKNLENYGEIKSEFLFGKPYRTAKGSDIFLSNKEIARAIKEIISTAKMKSKDATFALPDFASFFTRFRLPPMTKEELPEAVKFEARQHIPLPLSEIVLDWQVIKEKEVARKQKEFHILLVAVPMRTVRQYQDIARETGLEKFALEAEVFGLIRSLIKERDEEKDNVCLIDMGAQTTSVSIIKKKNLIISRSFDSFSGNILTNQLARSLNISLEEAEDLKIRYGLTEEPENLKSIFLPLVDDLIQKIKRIFREYSQKESSGEVKKIILTGGTSKLIGLGDYLSQELVKEVKIGDPFKDIFYPSILEERIEEFRAPFSVAVGVACRKIV